MSLQRTSCRGVGWLLKDNKNRFDAPDKPDRRTGGCSKHARPGARTMDDHYMESRLSGYTGKTTLTDSPLFDDDLLRGYNLGIFEDRLRFLYRQVCWPQESCDAQAAVFLEAGCRILAAATGIIVSSSGSIYRHV